MATNKQWANKEWFRNTEWNPEIEAKFFEKLRRARDKAQYLKLQAYYLADSHPKVALALLDKFFALGEGFFLADALVAAANAHLAMGQTGEALNFYKRALDRERQQPCHKTTAWIEFALLVADRRLKDDYDEALRVLDENQTGLSFPIFSFVRHGVCALIQAERGNRAIAKDQAIKALQAADAGRSGLRYHPGLGLVGPEHDGIRKRLRHLTEDGR